MGAAASAEPSCEDVRQSAEPELVTGQGQPVSSEVEERSNAKRQQRLPSVRGFLDPAKGGLQVQLPPAERPSDVEAMPPPSAPKRRKVYGAALPPPGWKPDGAQPHTQED